MVRKNISLTRRLATSTLLQMIALFVLATGFFLMTNATLISHTLLLVLRGYSESLTERVDRASPGELGDIAHDHRVGLVVRKPDGNAAFDHRGHSVAPDSLMRGHRTHVIRRELPGGGEVDFVWDQLILTPGHVHLFGAHLILVALVIGVAFLFQRRQLKPLRWLHEGVEAVAAGDLKTRVPVMRRDEIGRVAEAFNQMTGQLEHMLAMRERLLADVSHELRSPLTRIKVALELLPESEKTHAIARDVAITEHLVGALLERQRLTAETDTLVRQPTSLKALADTIATEFAGEGVTVTAGEEVTAAVDATLIGLLLRNLVDNAIRHSGPDCRSVHLEISRSADGVVMVVADEGPGIPAAEHERVFEPFVKLDKARGHGGSYGLGLDLCRRIVLAHGGTIAIEDNAPRGTRVRICLPFDGDQNA